MEGRATVTKTNADATTLKPYIKIQTMYGQIANYFYSQYSLKNCKNHTLLKVTPDFL